MESATDGWLSRVQEVSYCWAISSTFGVPALGSPLRVTGDDVLDADDAGGQRAGSHGR